jgi:hypothetical protein
MINARSISYELADRANAVTCGGIGALHLLLQRLALPETINRHVHVLRRHLP